MPARNVIKTYIKDGYYHVYNRGVEKRKIFLNKQDYSVFLNYIKSSLLPPPDPLNTKASLQGENLKKIYRQPKNFHQKIELIAFCLMPNHFHLLLRQLDDASLQNFMRSLLTRYSMYFNKKYDRVGSLFQGPYKAVLIPNENYLLHLSRYIHLNPEEYTNKLTEAYSSYGNYLGMRKSGWLKPDMLLSFFNNSTKDYEKKLTYKDFVEGKDAKIASFEEMLGNLIIE